MSAACSAYGAGELRCRQEPSVATQLVVCGSGCQAAEEPPGPRAPALDVHCAMAEEPPWRM